MTTGATPDTLGTLLEDQAFSLGRGAWRGLGTRTTIGRMAPRGCSTGGKGAKATTTPEKARSSGGLVP